MRTSRLGIFVAAFIGVSLIAAALWWRATAPSKDTALTTSDGAVVATGRTFIKTTDSNADGVPDWQDQLIKTPPIYLDELASSTDTFDTVTERYSINFFNQTLSAASLGLLGVTKDALIDDTIRKLEEEAKEPLYTRDDLTHIVIATDAVNRRNYGNGVAAIIVTHNPGTRNELEIFNALLSTEDKAYLDELEVVRAAYENTIAELLTYTVPEDLTTEHVAIINSFSALETTVAAMQVYLDDPFVTQIRLRRFTLDVEGLHKHLVGLFDALYLERQVPFGEGDPLWLLVDGLRV